MHPKVAIIILNWNGWRDTIDLLETIKDVSFAPLLIVIVDNSSNDNSVQEIEGWLETSGIEYAALSAEAPVPPDMAIIERMILLLQSETNLGFCAGNNLGMNWAVQLNAEYLLVLNNDTLVSPDFIQPLVEASQKNDSVGLVGGLITYCNEPDTVWWAGGTFNHFLDSRRLLDGRSIFELERKEPYETAWISGCMMMIPAYVFSRYGGYADEYFIWAEEWDYSLMLAEAGYRHLVVPQSRICHKVGRSLGIMKPLSYYYGIRNNIMLKRKYLPKWLWYPFILYYLPNRLIRYTQLLLQGRIDLVRAGIAAVADGLRGRTGKWQNQPD